jgi:hypothetical protein
VLVLLPLLVLGIKSCLGNPVTALIQLVQLKFLGMKASDVFHGCSQVLDIGAVQYSRVAGQTVQLENV